MEEQKPNPTIQWYTPDNSPAVASPATLTATAVTPDSASAPVGPLFTPPPMASAAAGAEAFKGLSIGELRALLQERDAAVVELRHEIQMMRSAPQQFKERLRQLESGVLGRAKAGTILHVDAPVLRGIKHAIVESHALQHEQAVDHHQSLWHGHPHYDQNLHKGPDEFVLGRGYMPIDQKYLAERRRKEELEHNPHPAITEMHYAGHCALPSQLLPGSGVGGLRSGGAGFWLEKDDSDAPRLAPERWAFSHDMPGDAEDAVSIDWLGRAKRGLPATKPSLQRTVGVPPRWLY